MQYKRYGWRTENTTGFQYRGYDIIMKSCESYLLFYTVDEAAKTVTVLRVMQDGMDWQYSKRSGIACFDVR